MEKKHVPRIDSYRFGRIVIDGQTHTKDVIILPDRVIPRWWRREGHTLHLADLNEVIAAMPAILVVGKGAFGRMRVGDDAIQGLKETGIELIELNSKEACQRYNELRERGDVALALHLSC